MTEDSRTLFPLIVFLFQILTVVGLAAGILYLAIIIKELIKGTLGRD